MVVLDTDVLLLAFAFQRDDRQAVNNAFLTNIQLENPAITIYSLMEFLGQMSFNLTAERLSAWQSWLIDAYHLTVIWPADPDSPISGISYKTEIFERPFERMYSYHASFMDALILNLAERTPGAEIFVTWNARHFRNKSSLKVLTPQEYLG
ncbi:MAG: type II toxin-antitoxin system VapC family toxin [Chloroflexota bacterium]